MYASMALHELVEADKLNKTWLMWLCMLGKCGRESKEKMEKDFFGSCRRLRGGRGGNCQQEKMGHMHPRKLP